MAANTPGTVREAMHEGAECIGENKTLLDAAKRMAELDIVVKALAQGRDPATPCGEFAQGTVHWIAVDASFDEALGMMRENAVKRLCVLGDDKKLTGIITEADIATSAPEAKTGEWVEAIATQPPQHF